MNKIKGKSQATHIGVALCAICVAVVSCGLRADDYYNSKTFSASETTSAKVYIGHANATDGGSASDALVTVQNGATWTAEGNVYLGNSTGTSRLVIDEGGTLYGSDSTFLYVGETGGGLACVTNYGTLNVRYLYFGEQNGGASTSRLDNFGSAVARYGFSMGERPATTSEAVFHNHVGASLSIERGSQYDFYVGGRSPARLVNEGTITCKSGTHVRIGGALTSTGTGVLVMTNSGSLLSGSTVLLGRVNNGRGRIEMYNQSSFDGASRNATVNMGGESGNSGIAEIMLADRSSFSCKTLNIGSGKSSTASITMKDDSTLSFQGDLEVAKSQNSTGSFILEDHSMAAFPTNVHLGVGISSVGTFGLAGATALTFAKDIRFGCAAGATGILDLDGTAKMTFPDDFAVENHEAGASACVRMGGDSSLVVDGRLLVGKSSGHGGEVLLESNATVCVNGSLYVGSCHDNSQSSVTGRMVVADGALLVCTNIFIGHSNAVSGRRKPGLSGYLEVGDSAMVSNAVLNLGAADSEKSSHGKLAMRGGKVLFNAALASGMKPLLVGTGGTDASGEIRGWGTLGYLDVQTTFVDATSTSDSGNANLYGQIVADGEGVSRTLDCGRIGVMSWNGGTPNTCGTNGWFAVNKGLLKMPRSLSRKTSNYDSVGDFPVDRCRFVNTFKYTFDSAAKAETGTYVWSELYATDRDDIPSGLPSGCGIHPAAVWRIGYFDSSAGPAVDEPTKDQAQMFANVKLRFHYTPELAKIDDVNRVQVYRHDGTAGGSWQIVGSAVPSESSPYVETATLAPGGGTWNIGWLAIVGREPVGAQFIIR